VRRRFNAPPDGVTDAPPTEHAGNTSLIPMRLLNGFLTDKPNRRAPSTDINHAPRDFRRYVDASGFEHVQLDNALHRKIATGLFSPAMLQQANYLTAIVPIIPGQDRQGGHGGFHQKGIDPQSYAALWQSGPGSQPVNPGGPGKIAAGSYYNPYAGGG
jgi:hypothetical protein